MLSILIPSRNEPYLQDTISDIREHAETDVEILVGLDGKHKEKPVSANVVFRTDNPIGQRAMTNKLAEMAKGDYLMKLDAHCAFSQGFDRKMLETIEDDVVMTPMLCRLDAKNWQIIAKPFTKKYYFDTNMVFQYGKAEDEVDDWGLVETMALQGSCFMTSKENYWKWHLCDEEYGSWGFQGCETACKTWFNGGRVITNTDVFYGHMFRVEDIPYERTKEEVEHARKNAHELLKHPKMPWLLEKFNYPCDWTPEKVKELCK